MRPQPALLIAAILAAALGCTRPSPLYCDEATPCTDPSIPFCDVAGVFQAQTQRCIANPFGDCQLPGDCLDPAAPICDPFIGCAPCTAVTDGDAACSAANAQSPVCEASGACGGCTTDVDCSAAHPLCDAATRSCEPCVPGAEGDIACTRRDANTPQCSPDGTCVECLSSDDCSDAIEGLCGDDGRCRGCIENHECESGVCDRDKGVCVAEDDIAYLRPLGDGDCSRANPCGAIGGSYGALAGRSAAKLAPGTYDESNLTFAAKWIIGEPGVVIDTGGTTTHVQYNTRIEDLSWVGPLSVSGYGGELALRLRGVVLSSEHNDLISLRAPGRIEIEDSLLTSSTQRLLISTDGTTEIRHSRLSAANNSALAIAGGELKVRSSVIENSRRAIEAPVGKVVLSESELRHNSGTIALWLAGSKYEARNNLIWGNHGAAVKLGGEHASSSTFDYNTVVDNEGTGIHCTSSAPATGNILWGNGEAQASGQCILRYSNIESGSAGEGNISFEPRFVAPGSGDYHLRADSPCIGAGDPNAANSTDFDGDLRPYGGTFDIGADEFAP